MAQLASVPSGRRLRAARVGERLPAEVVGRAHARRLDASALLVPGRAGLADYRRALEAATDAFAAWDGRAAVLPADGEREHRMVIVDRYRQVYEVLDAPSVDGLPSPGELEEWFKFLATMCPECGVLDDPIGRGWTP